MGKLETLYRLCDEDFTGNYCFSTRLRTGDLHFDLIWLGTLKSFFDRLHPSGFCATSFGEENNITPYGKTHYGRDTAVAAQVLAEVGRPELADLILAFNLDNIPEGQYYIPHVYWGNGSVAINTIQVDTINHQACALREAVAVGGATPLRHRLFTRLTDLYDGIAARHFHPEIGLYDAGNFNEQGYGGTSEALAEMFTNASMEDGHRAMACLARQFGDSRAEAFQTRSDNLAEAIEKHMGGHPDNGYCNGVKWPSMEKLEMLNWVPLYSRRWHTGNDKNWDKYWRQLVEKTSLDWDGFRLVTCELPENQYRVFGKVFAAQLGFCATTGRLSELKERIAFAAKTVVHPLNLYPEWWFHHRPATLSDCMRRSLENHLGVYESYCENPDGDYTYDSGNCEQCAAFLHDVWRHVAGVTIRPDTITLAPALLSPMSVSGGPHGLSWHWDGQTAFTFKADCTTNWQISLPAAKDRRAVIRLDGAPLNATRLAGKEIDWLKCSLPARASGEISLC